MKLGDFLRDASRGKPVNPLPVTFTAVGKDAELRDVKAEVTALLVCVDEDRRQAIRVEAVAACAERFPGKEIPPAVLSDEQDLRLMFHALKQEKPDDKGRYLALCDTVAELKSSLVLVEAQRLGNQYQAYLKREFPSQLEAAEWAELREEAKKSSVSDLLTSYGFGKVVQLVTFLAETSTK